MNCDCHSNPHLPDGWTYDVNWRVAVILLDALDNMTASGLNLWGYVHPAGIDYPGMLREDWADWQLPLLHAARSLWDGQPVDLRLLAFDLDEVLWHRLLLALATLREYRR
jgi:hypothetical protein